MNRRARGGNARSRFGDDCAPAGAVAAAFESHRAAFDLFLAPRRDRIEGRRGGLGRYRLLNVAKRLAGECRRRKGAGIVVRAQAINELETSLAVDRGGTEDRPLRLGGETEQAEKGCNRQRFCQPGTVPRKSYQHLVPQKAFGRKANELPLNVKPVAIKGL